MALQIARKLHMTCTCSSSASSSSLKALPKQRQQQPARPQPVIAYSAVEAAARFGARVGACVAAAAVLLCFDPLAAHAAGRKAPPITESAGRCDVAALDKFADVSILSLIRQQQSSSCTGIELISFLPVCCPCLLPACPPACLQTRATFSQEAAGGNMTEAIVDIRGGPQHSTAQHSCLCVFAHII